MDHAIIAAIAEKKTPGGVLWLENNGQRYTKAYGNRALVPKPEAMTVDTIFDAASLTKVIATTPAILLLIERGKILLDAPAQTYLREFRGNGKENIAIRHLLTHTSGLRPDLSLEPPWSGYDKAIELACAEIPRQLPGLTFVYSDINFIVLGEIVRRVSGLTLHEFTRREIFQPLGMSDTGFRPPARELSRIAPTEKRGNEILRGVVHDPTARRMNGVAGHAGLFTTAADLARFARMMLNQGTLDGRRVFKPETVQLMTSVQSPPQVAARRGLGWDIDSPYAGPRGRHFPIGSYGHTGWTGTSIWIDPYSRTFLLFLANRNHPTEDGTVVALRSELGTLAAESIIGFNFAYVPQALPARPATRTESKLAAAGPSLSAGVLNGIDLLEKQKFAPLRKLRVGLITNQTGVDQRRRPTIDLLREAPEVRLVALFSPEHGIRGELDENVADATDEKTGLPIFSLYGKNRKPSAEQLKNLDALVFDIQDIGCRFYTYISTLGLCMEAAAEAGKKFIVLDRVNPIGGTLLEGPVAGDGSFTAFHPIPVRHGMTVGELARLFKAEKKWQLDLTVVPVQGWSRDLLFEETDLAWTSPSPNMRNVSAALLYPGIGLLETTALSVGRGTDSPFEVIGAPYIDDLKFCGALSQAGLAGVRFVPIRFKPSSSTFKEKWCGGARVVLLDRRRPTVPIGLAIAQTLHRLYPKEFGVEKFNRLLLDPAAIEALRSGKNFSDIEKGWEPGLKNFARRREPYLLYPSR